MQIFSTLLFSQLSTIKEKIEALTENFSGRIGIAVIDLQNNDSLTINRNFHYPMQSVFKFPLAISVLNQVDKGKLSLHQKIPLTKENLLPRTWSPLREKYPNGNSDATLDEILKATVSLSDNNGCDILFALLGGTSIVNTYIHSLGISEIEIVATEEEMHKEWNVQYQNFSTPYAMALLLKKFYQDSILSKQSTEYLWQVMANTSTGVKRLKGKLPEGTIVAHKTGSSGENEAGLAAATNDVGIIILPNNKKFAIAVFVANSKEPEQHREEIIANAAKVVGDYFLK